MKLTAYFILLIFYVCSCNSSYKQAFAYNSEGFIDTRLGRNVFKITYNGAAFTSLNKAVDYCLLRCAEICLERGYKYFRITKDSSGIYSYVTKNPDVYGHIQGQPVVISGGYSQDIPRAVAQNIIVCESQVPLGEKEFLDAKKVYKFLKQRYE